MQNKDSFELIKTINFKFYSFATEYSKHNKR